MRSIVALDIPAARWPVIRALAVPDFRRYLAGQVVSLSGNWMQVVAQGLLVLDVTGSGTVLGTVTAVQFLPLLVLGPFGGLIADRYPKRRLLLATNSLAGLSAGGLSLLVATDRVELWTLYLFAGVLGLINVVDQPARHTIVHDLVGGELLSNAVSLNTVVNNVARAIGPAIAALLVAWAGLAACFLYDAVSFLPALVALATLRLDGQVPSPPARRSAGQLREGVRYAVSVGELLGPLLIVTVVGTVTWEFQVTLPLLAERTFGDAESLYGIMTAAMGAGAIAGGLWAASRSSATIRELRIATCALGATVLAVAVAPRWWWAVVTLVPMGAAGIGVVSLSNSILQAAAPPEMRGRIIALWVMAFAGSTPVGGPIVGWIADHAGARWALVVGGLGAVVTAPVSAMAQRRSVVAARVEATDGAAQVGSEPTG
jgi:MFS family permease